MSMAPARGRAGAVPSGMSNPAGGSNAGTASGDGNGRPAGPASAAAPRSTSGLDEVGWRLLLAMAAKEGSVPTSVPVHTSGTAEPIGIQLLLPAISGAG